MNTQTRDEEGELQDTIEREVHIDAPVERVWALVTQAEHLGIWFADAGARIDLRPGGLLELTWKEQGLAQGRVERVEEPTRFAFRWTSSGPFDEAGSTLVEFTLSAAGDGTTVRVIESGFAALADGEQRHADHTEGWSIELGHLVDHAEGAGA